MVNKSMLKRGTYVLVNLGKDNAIGSEQAGTRPAIIIQNDMGNKYSPTVIVVFLTTSNTKAKIPTHVELNELMNKQSLVLGEQIRTISKKRIIKVYGQASEESMKKVDKALMISLGLK